MGETFDHADRHSCQKRLIVLVHTQQLFADRIVDRVERRLSLSRILSNRISRANE